MSFLNGKWKLEDSTVSVWQEEAEEAVVVTGCPSAPTTNPKLPEPPPAPPGHPASHRGEELAGVRVHKPLS